MQRTMAEKINYNSYLVKVYPKEYMEQKMALEEENESLRKRIQALKDNNNSFDYRLNKQNLNQPTTHPTTEIKERFGKINEELKQPDYYVRHPEFKPFNYNGTH